MAKKSTASTVVEVQEKKEVKRLEITISRAQSPCLWESGGNIGYAGKARIIADAKGKKKVPLYVRQTGRINNGDHALLPITEGDYVIAVSKRRENCTIEVWRITSINEKEALLEHVTRSVNGEWETNPPEILTKAIESAIEKASCYKCRHTHYTTAG